MPSCCLKNCHNRTGIKENNANGVFFHLFPSPDKSPERFSKWMHFAGSPNYSPYIRLCSYHFEPKYMDERQLLRQKLLREIGEKVLGPSLKPGAVPSLRTTDLPGKCFVKGCTSDSKKLTFPNRFHSPERFKSWVSFCNQELLPGVKAGICLNHFIQEDFEENLDGGVKVLNKDIVPTRREKKSNENKLDECTQTALSQEKESSNSKQTSNKKLEKTITSNTIVNSEKSIKKSKSILHDSEIYLINGNQDPGTSVNRFVCLPSKENSLVVSSTKDPQTHNVPGVKYVLTVKPTVQYVPAVKTKPRTTIHVSNEQSKKPKLLPSVIRRIEATNEANSRISLVTTSGQSEIIQEPSANSNIQVKPLHLLTDLPGDVKVNTDVLSVKTEYNIETDSADIKEDSKTGVLETLLSIKEETSDLEISTEHMTANDQKYSETIKMQSSDPSAVNIETGDIKVEEIEIKEEPLPIWF